MSTEHALVKEAFDRGRSHGDISRRYADAYGSDESPRAEAMRRAKDEYGGRLNELVNYAIGFVEGWASVEAEVNDGRNHAHAITTLRSAAEAERDSVAPTLGRALKFEAVAALLECHDATGINLATFGAVGQFVNHVLDEFGFPPFTDNGV